MRARALGAPHTVPSDEGAENEDHVYVFVPTEDAPTPATRVPLGAQSAVIRDARRMYM